MNFLENFPCVSSAIFLIGLFLIGGGIRIVRAKNILLVGKYAPNKSRTPQLVAGKNAVFHGIQYIFGGILFIILAIAMYSSGR